jgi:Protein of unknown function (DUF1565)
MDTNAGTSGAPFRTIRHAVSVATAQASTITVRAGTYTEQVSIPSGATPLVLRAAAGEVAIIDGTGLTVTGGQQGLIDIGSRSGVTIEGFEVRNFRSTNSSVPLGIFAQGSGDRLRIVGNHLHDIVTAVGSCNGNGGNAFGLAVYGTTATPWTNVFVQNNELDHLTLGCSESLSINGNVDGFEVSGNRVHDNDNIGIVAIGFEGTGPSAAVDQARNGVIRGNRVWNIASLHNPAYNGESSADGIYVDGGKQILIEQNLVSHADLAIEVASEHAGRSSSMVLVRNNVIAFSPSAGLSVGGYSAGVGNADHVVLINNTLCANTIEFQVQFHISEVRYQNNVVFSPTSDFTAGTLTGATQTTNLLRSGTASSTFVNPAMDTTGNPVDLHTLPSLAAQVVGQGTALTCPSGWACPTAWGTDLSGALDVSGHPRVSGALDLGAWEQ